MRWRWDYFKPHEVLGPSGLAQYAKGNLMLQEFALDHLQSIRAAYGKPLMCNGNGLRLRGYRSPSENTKIGGAILSRHVQGIAFDLTPTQEPLAYFMAFLETAADTYQIGGIGFYPSKNFIHIDWRPRCFPEPKFWID